MIMSGIQHCNIPLASYVADHGWEMVGIHMPTCERIYSVRYDIGKWIETQPSHLWKAYDAWKSYDAGMAVPCYMLSEELLVWMTLKFH
jgi:hypothetical protein